MIRYTYIDTGNLPKSILRTSVFKTIFEETAEKNLKVDADRIRTGAGRQLMSYNSEEFESIALTTLKLRQIMTGAGCERVFQCKKELTVLLVFRGSVSVFRPSTPPERYLILVDGIAEEAVCGTAESVLGACKRFRAGGSRSAALRAQV